MSNANPMFGPVLHAMTALNNLPKRDQELTWHEFDDLGDRKWVLQIGYTTEIDDGNVSVWIHKIFLNTGQRDLELTPNEIDVSKWEAWLVSEEEARLDAEAQCRGDDDDRGDWEYEQRKDREANK